MSDAFHCVRAYTGAELKRMRAAVERGDVNLTEIAKRFRCSRHTVVKLIATHGWHDTRGMKSQQNG